MLLTSERVRIRVLIVDDNPDHRELMARRLRQSEIDVVTVGSGEAALATIQGGQDPVDLVLLDYRLPRMSGIDTCRAIREETLPPSVVIITGMGSTEVAVEALRAGAIDYLAKNPGYLKALPTVVQRAWRQHDLARRARELQRLAMLVHSATQRDEVVDEIVGGAKRLLRAEIGALALDEGEGIRLLGFKGPDTERIARMLQPSGALPAPGDVEVRDADRALLVALPADVGEAYGVLVLLDAEVPVQHPEELELARAFASFAGIALRNLRRRELEESLIGELTRTVEARRDFVASVSHELRTPLTSIGGYAETVLGHWDVLDAGRKRDFVAKIRSHAGELGRLVDQLIDIAGLERGQGFQAVLGRIELAKAVRGALSSMELFLGGRPVEVDVPDLAAVADGTLLQRTLANLISNAVKFSEPGTPIRVTAVADSDHGLVRVCVTDQGRGLEPEDAAHVFEPFWRARGSVTDAVRGSGIGLSLVREYVRTMGGDVSVESVPGEGSTFAFTLPLANGVGTVRLPE